jgi:hypothetical protein
MILIDLVGPLTAFGTVAAMNDTRTLDFVREQGKEASYVT